MPIDEDLDDSNQNEDFEDPNDRRPMRLLDSRRQADGELSDSEDEGEGGRRNHAVIATERPTTRTGGISSAWEVGFSMLVLWRLTVLALAATPPQSGY